MALGEQIKEHRKNMKLSQEKVAELVGVSRQAVTKWEANQSAPSTENLFKLAKIFNMTVDTLLNPDKEITHCIAEQIYDLYKMEEKKNASKHRAKVKKNILFAFMIAVSYLIIYLIGRFIWCSFSDSSFIGWLVLLHPSGENSYLYGWLLSSNLFWVAMAISVIPALWGKYKFSSTTLAAFIIGLLLGMLLGPNPAGAAYGHDHYGWAIWSGIYFGSVIVGILLEHFVKSGNLFKDKAEKDDLEAGNVK